MKKSTIKRLTIVCAVALLLGLSGLIGALGCDGDKGSSSEPTQTTDWTSGTASAGAGDSAFTVDETAALAPEAVSRDQVKQSSGSSLTAQQTQAGQRIMKTAILDLEVKKGEFQSQFEKAQQLAGLYGGYVLSSDRAVSGEKDVVESGTVTIRVSAVSFDKMMTEARKLGDPQYENTTTQDVTSDYIDLKARVTNQQAYVNSILALYAKAKTVEQILSVQQTLSYAQQELEMLKGQLLYLENNTTYSTLTMNIYETGARPSTDEGWGFVQALKDCAHNVVKAFSAVVRGLGWLIPSLIVLGIVAGIAYLIVKSATRRTRQRKQEGEGKTS